MNTLKCQNHIYLIWLKVMDQQKLIRKINIGKKINFLVYYHDLKILVSLQNLIRIVIELGYPESKAESDVKRFYQNVLESDSPITYLNSLEEVQ